MAEVQNRDRLKIDSVLSTQSELGPSIPDGGYGWIIVLTTMFFQILIPSLIVAYGIIVLFIREENVDGSIYPSLWDNPTVYAPLFFIATWTFVDPWIRKLIETSKWPRLVITSGVCLTCAGLLLIWFVVAIANRIAPWFLASGILSGVGASLIISQCEIIIGQYFKLKLRKVNVFIQCIVAVGFIITPSVLGRNMFIHGNATPIIWYQIIILQGLIVAMFIKKPPYLKNMVNPYKLIQGPNDDEIDIFPSANNKELQYARYSKIEEVQHMDTTSSDQAGLSLADELAASALKEEESRIRAEKRSSSLIDIQVHASENGNLGWVQFDDDNQNKQTKSGSRTNLQKKHFVSTSQDLDRIDTFEDSFVHVPKPLFSESHINNNNTYSFDGGESVTSEEPVVFMPVPPHKQPGFFDKHLYFFKQPTFYKSLLQIITTKYSTFVFYALFPSYLYLEVQPLRIQDLSVLVGYISFAHLMFAALTILVENLHRRKALFLWISSWNGAIGFILISDARHEGWFIVGAIQIVLSIQSLQYFGGPLLKLNRKGESNTVYLALSSIAGLSFFLFFAIDISYANCFRVMAFFQFIMGGIWFANFTFKKVKHLLIARG